MQRIAANAIPAQNSGPRAKQRQPNAVISAIRQRHTSPIVQSFPAAHNAATKNPIVAESGTIQKR